MNTENHTTVKEIQDQILITKINEPLNHTKIQKLQQLLDKLTGSVPQ